MLSRASNRASNNQSSWTPGRPKTSWTPSRASDCATAWPPVSVCRVTRHRLEDDDVRSGLTCRGGELVLQDRRRGLVEQIATISPRHVDAAVALIGAEIVVPVRAMNGEATVEVVLGVGHIWQVVIAAGVADARAGHVVRAVLAPRTVGAGRRFATRHTERNVRDEARL